MPVLNIPRAEFPLRSDSIFLLRETGLSQDYLLFRDEVDLHGLHKNKQLTLTLVDHNVLPRSVFCSVQYMYCTMFHLPSSQSHQKRNDKVVKFELIHELEL